MAKFSSNTRVYGTMTVDLSLFAGCSFQNMEVLTLSYYGNYVTYKLPPFPGAKFKLTLIGAGGGGAGVNVAGGYASSGGSGAVVIAIITIVPESYTFSYSIGYGGAGGTITTAGLNGGDTTVTYNGITYTAGGGRGGNTIGQADLGGQGGSAAAGNGILNLPGNPGNQAGIISTTNAPIVRGGNTPLGYGSGGIMPTAGGSGLQGINYGSGGSGAIYRSGGNTGGDGAYGLIIVEY